MLFGVRIFSAEKILSPRTVVLRGLLKAYAFNYYILNSASRIPGAHYEFRKKIQARERQEIPH